MKKSWEIHLFHSVLEKWMIIRLKDVTKLLKGGFSEVINFIFGLYRHRIYQMQCSLKDQESRYRPLEKAQTKNIALFEINYQQMKKMHHDHNFFSMSQILRLILKEFFELLDTYGWEETIKRLQNESRKLRSKHLSSSPYANFQYKSRYMHMKNVILALYSRDFKLITLDIYPPDS